MLDALNAASARAATSPAVRSEGGLGVATIDYHGASRADIVIATVAAVAIGLITGPRRHDLRACAAPGCVLMLLKDRARREWCSRGVRQP